MTPTDAATTLPTTRRTPQARWLHCPTPLPDPRRRLVCFPHAGGSAAFYRDWGRQLPGTEVHAVRYPGRAERIAEPPATDLRALAADIADAVEPLADRPLLLFGHSMGAAVALETARRLESRGIHPAHLVASGSRDAPYPQDTEALADDDEDDATVVARLLALGGTDPELAADPEFQELVLPYVRADGALFHGYTPRPDDPALSCPVTTVVGDADDDADRRPWHRLTTGPHREQGVTGDHFYLVPSPPFALLRNL
ncbi:alpha/beta fold hydrolase [Streptomyces sp. LHD-70]|uniref:thioesterase II family protein n=1 Tax=Streptomyces sp. LHD-70 TaxID=3072140 RepID=UPI0028106F5D|nr:alpha/beta fold hydrolase [Streptomyces sp. LHD-70]MDQ8706958.1 alpha/beta fold hydrolase [Streptomyces sp. LHD-70]